MTEWWHAPVGALCTFWSFASFQSPRDAAPVDANRLSTKSTERWEWNTYACPKVHQSKVVVLGEDQRRYGSCFFDPGGRMERGLRLEARKGEEIGSLHVLFSSAEWKYVQGFLADQGHLGAAWIYSHVENPTRRPSPDNITFKILITIIKINPGQIQRATSNEVQQVAKKGISAWEFGGEPKEWEFCLGFLLKSGSHLEARSTLWSLLCALQRFWSEFRSTN